MCPVDCLAFVVQTLLGNFAVRARYIASLRCIHQIVVVGMAGFGFPWPGFLFSGLFRIDFLQFPFFLHEEIFFRGIFFTCHLRVGIFLALQCFSTALSNRLSLASCLFSPDYQ